MLNQKYLLSKIFSDDLPNLLHGALRSSAVQNLQGGGVLLGQQIVQSTKVLAYFDEGAPVDATQVSKALCWSSVHLQEMEYQDKIRLLCKTHDNIF